MSEIEKELIICSGCNCKKLISFFEIRKNTGIRLKTCIQCRRKFKCDKCDKGFSSNSALQRHINTIHHKTKEFKCDRCDYVCNANSDLKRHIKRIHDKIKEFKCDRCDYVCNANSDLKRHIKRIHDKIKDCKCNRCDFVCCTNSDLNKHIKQVHLKIKDFECNMCDFVCCVSCHLNEHIKLVHFKERNYKCDKCESVFGTNTQKKQHIKAVHDKIKDFKCDTCDSVFSAKSTLKRHIKQIHDKIRDFKCDTCDYICSNNSDLKKHMETCTGEFKGSSGEYKIKNFLDEMEIDYVYNGSHNCLRNYNDRSYLRFDFIIPFGDNRFCMIEFDGEQHFKPICFSGDMKHAVNRFEVQKKNDEIKNEYCKNNNYPLLRIRYDCENVEELITEFLSKNSKSNLYLNYKYSVNF